MLDAATRPERGLQSAEIFRARLGYPFSYWHLMRSGHCCGLKSALRPAVVVMFREIAGRNWQIEDCSFRLRNCHRLSLRRRLFAEEDDAVIELGAVQDFHPAA